MPLNSALVGAALAATMMMGGGTAGDDALLKELGSYSPEMTQEEVRSSVDEFAQEQGITFDEALTRIVTEARPHERKPKGDTPDEASGGGGGTMVHLPLARGWGDIFWTQASSFGVKHGHVGIYASRNTVVEAPGGNLRSREIGISGVWVQKGNSRLMFVRAKGVNRERAVYEARQRTNKAYRNSFWSNKKTGLNESYNCSQLVWAAYKMQGIDLDHDGGPAVYPMDIRDDNDVEAYPWP